MTTETLANYLHDPRILEDKELVEAPACVKRLHAIRLRIQDKTAPMTAVERDNYYRASRAHLDAECRRLGFTVQYADSI